MDFTYSSYRQLIIKLKIKGYAISTYQNWQDHERCAILRHDIDNDISKAVIMARIEKELGVNSTYFVLVTSDFYNIFSATSESQLLEILSYGHSIGLHFDELRYSDIKTPESALKKIREEAELLSKVTHRQVETVSMHRPSKMMLSADLKIPGMVNSYGQVYFKEFKYVSDSRRRWREPIEEIVSSGENKRLHILTHAIWYNENNLDIHDSVCSFINSANKQRYNSMQCNITDLQSIMSPEEVQ